MKPGRCNRFLYNFTIEGKLPNSTSTRSIPFAFRKQVREQIQEMVENGILGELFSDFINPLTVVICPNNSICICADARKINYRC
jgi:hypothetical protein